MTTRQRFTMARFGGAGLIVFACTSAHAQSTGSTQEARPQNAEPSPEAHAQSTGFTQEARPQNARPSPAEELLEKGRAALAAHDYEGACTRFAQSLALERAIGTLVGLAECEEARNRLTLARTHWQEAADLADAKDDTLRRGALARHRFTAVDRRVPRLTVHLASGLPRGAALQCDDVLLKSGSVEVSLLVDPGPHVITIRAEGREERRYDIELAPGERRTLEVECSATDCTADASVGDLTTEGGESGSTQRTIGAAVGGLGVAAVIIGSYLGLQALSEWANAKNGCAVGCPAGSNARSDGIAAASAATASTVAFGVGAAALTAGIVLLVTAPPARVIEPSRVMLAPEVDLRGGTLGVLGTW